LHRIARNARNRWQLFASFAQFDALRRDLDVTLSPTEPREGGRESPPPTKALPPDEVAALIVWIASAPPELVLNEAIVTPLEEGDWP